MTPRAQPVLHCFKLVAERFNIPLDELLTKRCHEPIRAFRIMAIRVAYEAVGCGDAVIGLAVNVDRSSVHFARERGRVKKRRHPWFKEQVELLVAQVKEDLWGSTKYVDRSPQTSSVTTMNGASSPA